MGHLPPSSLRARLRLSRFAPRTRVLLVSALAVLGLFFAACLGVALAGLTQRHVPSDCAIVLGNKVEPNGRPSQRLKARLDKTVELYRAGLFSHVIVSGGTGKEGHDEAQVMKRELVAAGVPPSVIVPDPHGTTTWETARNSASIMKERGWSSALVISQYFHVPRCRLACRKTGIQEVNWSHADYFALRDLYSVPREVPALFKYALRRS